MFWGRPRFPRRVESALLGTLSLHTFRYAGNRIHRSYKLAGPVAVRSERVRVAQGGVKLVIWVPKSGIGDPSVFVDTVERRWRTLTGGIDTIIESAVPAIEAGIRTYWQIEGEPAPSAATILDDGVLHQINLDAGHEGHRLIIRDAGDHIGCADMNVEFDNAFAPEDVGFDS